MIDKPAYDRTGNAVNPSYHTCSICGKTFDDLARAQKHMTIEHMQKGELPT